MASDGDGREEGVKGARYNFVRAARRPSEKEEKDLCISKNGRKTSERGRSRILFVRGPHASFFLARSAALRPQWQLGRTDRQARSGPSYGVRQGEALRPFDGYMRARNEVMLEG